MRFYRPCQATSNIISDFGRFARTFLQIEEQIGSREEDGICSQEVRDASPEWRRYLEVSGTPFLQQVDKSVEGHGQMDIRSQSILNTWLE